MAWKTIKIFLKKHFRKILKEYGSQLATTISMIVSVVISILSSLLYQFFLDLIKENVPLYVQIILIIIFIIATLYLFFLIACIIQWFEKQFLPEAWEDRYMKSAILRFRQLGFNRQASFQDSFCSTNPDSINSELVKEFGRCMQLAVRCCYEFFANSFSDPNKLVEDIRFEVTFMTESYKDQGITIPYSANKENRTPISMLQRENNPHTYDHTETAKIYAAMNEKRSPTMILIEDTNAGQEDYAEIYDGQKARIRSSVVFPVLSHRTELLGTLVVCCDQVKFFKQKQYDFWHELLEMFSVEIGYNKLMMDYYIRIDDTLEKPF